MKQVKKITDYWCEDTLGGKFLGQGVGVAVFDTGIGLHPDFDDRIAAFQDVINGKRMLYDDNGHGTHVAGIIGGSGRLSDGVYAGMAPLCHFIVVKVLDEKGDGDIENVIKGIRWVQENQKKYNILIVNISVGTLPHVGDREEQRLLQAVEELWDDGFVVVAAAGNYGPGKGTVTTPGVSKKIITVGSSNDQQEPTVFGRQKKNYSGRGPTKECVVKPDLVAPGSNVYSCNSRYGRNMKAYVPKSGTSMSTPVVSGAVAVLLSKYPDMSNVELKLKLRQTSRRIADGKMNGWGALRVDGLLE